MPDHALVRDYKTSTSCFGSLARGVQYGKATSFIGADQLIYSSPKRQGIAPVGGTIGYLVSPLPGSTTEQILAKEARYNDLSVTLCQLGECAHP